MQGYSALGFRRTIFLELRDTASAFAMIGLGSALAIIATWWLVRWLLPASRQVLQASFLQDLARREDLRWRLSAFILGLGWLAVTVAAYLDAPRKLATATAISAAFLLLMIWGSARAVRRYGNSDAPAFQALLAAGYGGTLAALAGGYWQNRPYLSNPGDPRNIIGNLALAIVVGLIVWSLRSLVIAGRLRPPLLAAAPIALLGVAWLATPMLSRPSLSAANPKSLILIGIDTLRLDDTSLIDVATRELTPNLKRLADRGVSFNQAVSQAPWTMPAFASIVTGKYPQEHGAFSLKGHLGKPALTLAELLREAGYRTSGIVAHRYVSTRHGFAQGFSSFNEENSVGHIGITSRRVTDLALDFLERPTDQPFFLFLHYFDPHYQYQDHEEFPWADGYRGWLRGPQNDFGNLRAKRHLLTQDDIGYLRDLYHEEIAATDREIGRVIDAVSARGLDDDVVMVVVADHGEEFMERGWLGHTISMHDEVIRVPLVMRIPGLAEGSRVDRPIETRQVFSTVLDALQIQGLRGLRRDSLLPLLSAAGDSPETYRGPTAAFSSALLTDAPIDSGKRVHLFAMQEGPWKLILDAARGTEQLFKLDSDPGETSDLAAVETEQLQAMRQQLQSWMQEMEKVRGKSSELKLGKDEIEQLKALGYL